MKILMTKCDDSKIYDEDPEVKMMVDDDDVNVQVDQYFEFLMFAGFGAHDIIKGMESLLKQLKKEGLYEEISSQ